MKIAKVTLSSVRSENAVYLEDGSKLERVTSLQASVDGSGMVIIKLEVLMPPAPTYRATDAERAIDSLNLD